MNHSAKTQEFTEADAQAVLDAQPADPDRQRRRRLAASLVGQCMRVAHSALPNLDPFPSATEVFDLRSKCAAFWVGILKSDQTSLRGSWLSFGIEA